MYYKITNKKSKVYKKLHQLRTSELEMEDENIKAIKEKIGLEFTTFLGHKGQQNHSRVTQYIGFKFTEPEKVDLTIWKKDKQHPEIFVPNRKTKIGKEIDEFLLNGTKKSSFLNPVDILGLEVPHRFSFPFIHIIPNQILLFLDDQFEPKDENVIEITKREFDSLMK